MIRLDEGRVRAISDTERSKSLDGATMYTHGGSLAERPSNTPNRQRPDVGLLRYQHLPARLPDLPLSALDSRPCARARKISGLEAAHIWAAQYRMAGFAASMGTTRDARFSKKPQGGV
jgi:hypothetical protein